jgi:hypothetical protein
MSNKSEHIATKQIRNKPALEPHEDRLLTMVVLGQRWDLHPKRALIRVRQLGLPIVQFNSRSLAVRLNDVIAAEEAATVR